MGTPTISLVMPTISWEEPFACCARSALMSLGPRDEALIVFDGSPPPPPTWLVDAGVTVLSTGTRAGPATARNLAAHRAHGNVLLFVDADVELHPDALEGVRARFASDLFLDALFGSYDDRPAAPGLVSRFRNLLHHHTHTSHPGPATTFWAGCGAVRRERFLALGGFDATTFDRPSIEDIEFGLRLSDIGGRIELDPTIQGTHHKHWTLASMVGTDIRQRAIPWSRLLLRRRQLPATLNLMPTARISGLASLLLPVGLVGLAVPLWRPWAGLLATLCLGLLLLLNRDFHGLLLRRRGPLEATIGVMLHILYLAYSSLTFFLVAAAETAATAMELPPWLAARPTLRLTLIRLGLSLLALLALAAIGKGLFLGWRLTDTDIYERLDEWRLFSEGIYPSAHLASPAQQLQPHFRTSVYLPWALPLFGLFFTWGEAWPWGEAWQGKLLIQALSLASLALIAAFGWRSLHGAGPAAGWLGALAPLAIAANSNALAQGQFSIVCMGLITGQWLLLARGRPLPAGLCWALAMIKPQIAAAFALPFLRRGRRAGLAAGLAVLITLTAGALSHTHTSPLAYLDSWFRVLPLFLVAPDTNANAAAGLAGLVGGPAALALLLVCGLTLAALGARAIGEIEQRLPPKEPSRTPPEGPPERMAEAVVRRETEGEREQQALQLNSLCAVAGAVAFYHLNYDNIMLFPVLLAVLQLALVTPTLGSASLAFLLAATLWTPQRILDGVPGSDLAQALIWSVAGLVLLARLLKRGRSGVLRGGRDRA